MGTRAQRRARPTSRSARSSRWVESYERIAERAAELPQTRHVCISDREGDLMAMMVHAHEMGHPADYLVRCKHNRCLPEGGKLWPAVMDSAPLGCACALKSRRQRAQGQGSQAKWTTENDIPDIIARFHNREVEATRERTEQNFFVPKDESRATTMICPSTSIKRPSMCRWAILPHRKLWHSCRDLQKIDAEMDAFWKNF